MMKLEYKIENNQYQNVKEILKLHFDMSDRFILKLKRNDRIYLNRKPAFVHTLVNPEDILSIDISFDEISENIVPTKMDLDIVFEDDTMLLVNKPAGIPVHPSMAHFEKSLSNGIQNYYVANNILTKIRPVNRLDKDTSGLVVFAKSEYIQECLIRQMANHTFQKRYLAILCGNLENNAGIIKAPIARKNGSIIEREINRNGQIAITHYKLLQNDKDFCLVEFTLETGRTHQIRVHCKHIGHPILGDTLYGTASTFIARQALHAYQIEFIHPITGKPTCFRVDLPNDMKKVIENKRAD